MLTGDVDIEQAMEFKDRLIDGANLSEQNPIAAVRRRLFSYGANNLNDSERLAILIHAWNLWRQDKTADTIYVVYNEAGAGSRMPLNNANFPVPQ